MPHTLSRQLPLGNSSSALLVIHFSQQAHDCVQELPTVHTSYFLGDNESACKAGVTTSAHTMYR